MLILVEEKQFHKRYCQTVSVLFSKGYKTIMIITKSIARDLSITPANNVGLFIEVHASSETGTVLVIETCNI